MASEVLSTQLAILGAGPGGYVAALRAADLGMDVALIDREPAPGGVCLWRGCIPSKALLHAREVVAHAREAHEFGVDFDAPRIDLDRLRDWKSGVVRRLTGGLRTLCKRRKVQLIRAQGRFADSRTISLEAVEGAEATPREVRFGRAILATGSLPLVPLPLQVKHPRVWGSREALDLPEVPERLLVVGGGYIGIELGQVYQGLGSRVTVVEMMDGILPATDRDLVKPLAKRVEADFEAVYLETRVDMLEPDDDGVTATFMQGERKFTERFDAVLVAVGRKPNTQGIGLERTGVELDRRGFARVNGHMQTTDERILAIGDAVGGLMLAHKASYEGKVAAEIAAGQPAANDAAAIPAVVFSDPEIAYCGLTEIEAEKRGIEVRTGAFPWSASGRALILGQSAGRTKLLADPETERILGVGMVGRGAGEMIGEGVLAVEMGAVADDLASIVHPHPTLSETIGEAAEAIFGKAIHAG